MERPRVVVLLNKVAGTPEQQAAGEALRDAVAAAFEKHGMPAQLEVLAGADLRAGAERALQKAMHREIDAVIVGGGDGSIRAVASVLAGSGISLGIVPLGTLNHFAKELGIPLTMDEAIATIAAGHARAVDVGDVNGRTFINNSSIGIYPYLVLNRDRIRRRRGLSKWTAMFLAGLKTLRYFPVRRLSIRGEGWVDPVLSPCVFVGNNEYRLAAPDFGTRGRLDGGELCVYVAKKRKRLALFWLALRTFLGFLNEARDLRIFKPASVEISSRRHRLLVAFDGEVEIIRSPLHYRTRPGALRVFAPATASTAAPAHVTSTIPT